MCKYWPFRKRSSLESNQSSEFLPRPSAAARERGAAKYFHGRTRILSNFADECWAAEHDNAGTTFLIQGAPGAGKTALLDKCAKRAVQAGWQIAHIRTAAFWDPNELHKSLSSGFKSRITGGSAQVDVIGIVKAEVSTDLRRATSLDLLQRGQEPLLLIIDEAQTMGQANAPPADQIDATSNVLTQIHNGNLDRPVMLLVGGLGTTRSVLESLGISRFERNCDTNLGSLSPESERAVLHDWLMDHANAKGDPNVWIDAITKETYGWPQHIMSYVAPALNQLDRDKGKMTLVGLDTVLKEGRVYRNDYYEKRAYGFHVEQLQCMTQALANGTSDKGVLHSTIMKVLTDRYEHDEAEELFRRALNKGIIEDRHGRYAVPIPSMYQWLLTHYPPQAPPKP